MSGFESTYFAIKRGIILTTLIISATLTGCASVKTAAPAADAKAKTFTTAPNLASFYIYRNEFLGGGIRMDVQVDGKPIGKTGPKTYFAFNLEPGTHTIVSSAENDSMLQVNAEAGKAYYVWQEVKMGLLFARNQLQLVDAAQGQSGVKESTLLEMDQPLTVSPSSVESKVAVASVAQAAAKQENNLNAAANNEKQAALVTPAKESAPVIKPATAVVTTAVNTAAVATPAPAPAPAPTPALAPTPTAGNNGASKINIEKIPFEIGVSSNNVERLAKQNNCPSSKGAGLIYKKGPIEVYRVTCDDGRELKARCELRQCELFKM